MSTILKFKRYTTVGTAGITGADGEITVDTIKDTLVVHDGITAGGFPLATEALLTASYYTQTDTNSAISTALTAYDTTTISEGKIATAVSNLVASAPSTLNTLKELSDALGADANYASTITTALGTKSPIESPTFTGTVTIPAGASISGFAPLASPTFTGTPLSSTAIKSTNTTQIATTAYVKDNLSDYATLASPTFTGIPAAPTAIAATNTTQVATTAFSQSAIAAAVQAALPAGVITMWSGSAAAIPTGWHLCDGTNSTPDLRGRFVMGSNLSYAVGATGGTDSITLTNTELPAHTHTGTTDADGIHSHFVANTDSVNPSTTGPLSNTNYIGKTGSSAATSSNYILGGSTTVPTQGLTSPSSSHTHAFTTESQGDGLAFSILPPYYALCYIMKHY